MLDKADHEARRGECRRVVSAGLERGPRMLKPSGLVSLMQAAPQIALLIAPGCCGMRRGVVRLKRERLVKQWERLLGIAWHRYLSMGQGAQIQVVGVQIFRALTLGTLDLGLAQAWLDCADYAEGDLILELENVAERAIVALGPDMATGRRLD